MQELFIVCLAAALAGCASNTAQVDNAREQRMATFNSTTDRLQAEYRAKRLTYGQMMARAADARLALAPGDPLAVESTYFWKAQAARVDKGEIAQDEFRFIVTRYENEQNANKRSQAIQALNAVSAAQDSEPVSCTRIGNSVTCF